MDIKKVSFKNILIFHFGILENQGDPGGGNKYMGATSIAPTSELSKNALKLRLWIKVDENIQMKQLYINKLTKCERLAMLVASRRNITTPPLD